MRVRAVVVSSLALLGVGCNSSKPVVPSPPVISTFTVSPTTLPVNGGDVTVTWATSNADQVAIDQGVGAVSASGTQVVHVTETTVFSITATSPNGSASQQAGVTVDSSAPAITSFTATPTALPVNGGDVTLTWASTGALTANISQGVGAVNPSGTQVVHVTASEGFVLTVQNVNGTATSQVSVTVDGSKPSITSFTVSPATLPPGGGSVTLSWTTVGADSVGIDQGIGQVVASGQQVINNVTSDRTFDLIATNVNGSATAQATVTVGIAPPVVSAFTATPSTLPPDGGQVTLSWGTANAVTTTIDQGVGAVSPTGTKVVSVSATQTFTLTATNDGGVSTAQALVTVLIAPSLTVTVTAPAGVTGSVTVAGPGGFSQTFSATTTLTDLVPGAYQITAAPVPVTTALFEDEAYLPNVSNASVSLVYGQADSETVTYVLHPSQGRLYVENATYPTGSLNSYAEDILMGTTDQPPTASLQTAFVQPWFELMDPNGNLWVVDLFSGLFMYTSAQLSAGGTPVPAVAITSPSLVYPRAAVFDDVGNLWVANSGNNTLIKFAASDLTSSGARVPTVILSGGGLSFPFGLAFHGGSLWVANYSNSTVTSYAAADNLTTGAPAPSVVMSSAAGSIIAPRSLWFDSAGNLWVTNFGNASISAFGPAKQVTGAPPPDHQTTSTAFVGPTGMTVDSHGNVWIPNYFNNTVVHFSLATLSLGGVQTPDIILSTNGTSLSFPTGVVVDSGDDLWISNGGGNGNDIRAPSLVRFGVHTVGASGAPLPTTVLTSPVLQYGFGMAVDAQQNVWVTNNYSNSIERLPLAELAGAAWSPPVHSVSLGVGLTMQGIAFDSSGNLWVTALNQSVFRLNPQQLAAGGPQVPDLVLNVDPGTWNYPYWIAFDALGNGWVANSGAACTVVKLTPTQLAGAGSPTPSVVLQPPSVNAAPNAIAFDPQGRMWIAYYVSNQIMRFDHPQALTSGLPTPDVILSGAGTTLNGPQGIALDAQGNLWVTNGNANTLLRFNAADIAATGSPVPALVLHTGLGFPATLDFWPHPKALPISP